MVVKITKEDLLSNGLHHYYLEFLKTGVDFQGNLWYNRYVFVENFIEHLVLGVKPMFTSELCHSVNLSSVYDLIQQFCIKAENLEFVYVMDVLRVRHFNTFVHSVNVAIYSLLMGIKMNLSPCYLDCLFVGACLHDIGKLCIPKTILDSPNRLTESQFDTIKQHPELGIRLLRDTSLLNNITYELVLGHHEKLNSLGYPRRLTVDNISNLTRIVTVADIFDAVITERSYHSRQSSLKGFLVLKDCVNRGEVCKDYVLLLYELVKVNEALTG